MITRLCGRLCILCEGGLPENMAGGRWDERRGDSNQNTGKGGWRKSEKIDDDLRRVWLRAVVAETGHAHSGGRKREAWCRPSGRFWSAAVGATAVLRFILTHVGFIMPFGRSCRPYFFLFSYICFSDDKTVVVVVVVVLLCIYTCVRGRAYVCVKIRQRPQ